MSQNQLSRSTNVYSSANPWWTAARERQLSELFHKGLSSHRIAVEMGAVSRSAIIGKLHRLGLRRETLKDASQCRGAPSIIARLKKEPVPRLQRPPPITLVRHAPIAAAAPAKAVTAADAPTIETDGVTDLAIVEAGAHRVPLLSAGKGQCRWPAADDGSAHMVCGADIATGTSYCAKHCRIAFASRPGVSRAGFTAI